MQGAVRSIAEYLKKQPASINRNKSACQVIDDVLGGKIIDAMGGVKDKTVIELAPGTGGLSRCLINAGAKKVIGVERDWRYTKSLKELEIESNHRFVGKIMELFIWHHCFRDASLLADIEPCNDWQSVRRDLVVCGTLPITTAHHYLPTMFRHVAARLGIFGWGRIEMYLLLPEKVAGVLLIPEGKKERSFLTLQGQAYCEFQHIFFVPKDQMDPPNRENFILTRLTPLSTPHCGTVPYEEYEYVIRQLYVQRGNPLELAIGALAPGAKSLLKQIPLSPKIVPRNMTIADFVTVAKAYTLWPHKQKIDDIEKLTTRDL